MTNKKDLFLAGTPFKAGRLLFTSFRYNKEGNHIEMQAFHPMADQWLYYCLVDAVTDKRFFATILFLGVTTVRYMFIFEDLEFLPTIPQEGGTDGV